MPDHRVERITEAIKEELSEMISYELSDPRISAATVTDVQISPDKRHVIFGEFEDEERAGESDLMLVEDFKLPR